MKIVSFLFFICFSQSFANLAELNHRIAIELDWIGYPNDWVKEYEGVFDVAIIGAGMSGCSAAFALKKLGIHRLVIYDENQEGKEGPWATYGHMRTLRSGKCTVGPSLSFPCLTFQAWYESKYGIEAWNCLEKATPEEWINYLTWFRKTLNLPVINRVKVMKISRTVNPYFQLHLSDGTSSFARKVVLATGRTGAGGPVIPDFIKEIPKVFFSHTVDLLDFQHLRGKSVAIIGCGSSAYDAAGEALEAGAKEVKLFFRRKEPPTKNLLGGLVHPGAEQGFYELKDKQKCDLIAFLHENGVSPPKESVARTKPYRNFHTFPETLIKKIDLQSNQLVLTTSRGELLADYLILATGFQINLSNIPEIEEMQDKICTWEGHTGNKKFKKYPYLGASFQFLPRKQDDAYIQDLYCFNYGALLSHGLVTSVIDSISAGAERLAKGIAADFFLQDYSFFLDNLDEEND